MEDIGTIIVRDWLQKYRGTMLDIATQREQLARLTNRMEQVSSPQMTDMPRNPSQASDRMSDAIARKDQLAARISEQLDFIKVTRELVDSMLYNCTPKARAIIRLRDLECMEWSEVVRFIYKGVEMTDKEYTNAYHALIRCRHRGIKKLATIMERTDGVTFPTLADVANNNLKKFLKK